MRVTILAIGRGRDPEIEALVRRYAKRGPWDVRLQEVVLKGKDQGPDAEAAALLARLPAGAKTVVLDGRGRDLDSAALAATLGGWRDGGAAEIACLIGGADGHGDAARARADLLLAFGRATWPHMLVRAMLAEQIYRAATILSGHPYHRG